MKNPRWLQDMNLRENWVWSLIAFLITMLMFWITGVFSGGWGKMVLFFALAFIVFIATAAGLDDILKHPRRELSKEEQGLCYAFAATSLFCVCYLMVAVGSVGTNYDGDANAVRSLAEQQSLLFRSFFALLIPTWAGIRVSLGRD